MNQVPVSARTAMLEALLALGTLKALAMEDTYTFDATHAYRDDLSAGDIAATATVGSPTVTAGEVTGTVTFTAVGAGPQIVGVWFYVDTGTPATSPLVAWVDQYADFRPVAIDPNGGNITPDWPSDRLFSVGSPV